MISPEMLRRYPYFARASDESLRQVAMFSDVVTHPAGTVLYEIDDKADELLIIVDGAVDIQYPLGSGEMRIVDTLTRGELVMWSALVPPYKSTAVVTARELCQLLAINGAKLIALCEQDHHLGYHLLMSVNKLLATRLEGARVQLATLD